MEKIFYQAKKLDVELIIDSSRVLFSKKIITPKNFGLLEITQISSENYSISGRNIVETVNEKFFLEKRKNLSSEVAKIFEDNLSIDKNFLNDFKNGQIIVGFEDHSYGFSSIPYFYWDSEKGWLKNDHYFDLGHIGIIYQATFSTSVH